LCLDEEYIKCEYGHSFCLDCSQVSIETLLDNYDEKNQQKNDNSDNNGDKDKNLFLKTETIKTKLKIQCTDILTNNKKINLNISNNCDGMIGGREIKKILDIGKRIEEIKIQSSSLGKMLEKQKPYDYIYEKMCLKKKLIENKNETNETNKIKKVQKEEIEKQKKEIEEIKKKEIEEKNKLIKE
jgi:hypothetical protein